MGLWSLGQKVQTAQGFRKASLENETTHPAQRAGCSVVLQLPWSSLDAPPSDL